MKKISKLLVGILFSALVIAPSYAGELTVTGGATATYTIGGDDAGSGKNLGISNELDFSASGELDNGYTWNYQVHSDGASAANDDTRLEIGTDFGTIGLYVTEGGMSKELHGVGALGAGLITYLQLVVHQVLSKQVMMLMVIQTFNTTHQAECLRSTN